MSSLVFVHILLETLDFAKAIFMTIEKLDIVRFAPRGIDRFYETVIEKVNAYFLNNHISACANTAMWIKSAVMMALYLCPYILIVTGYALLEQAKMLKKLGRE
jgi:Ni,Fe-hydrogenase I cytochrome b subunit